MRTERELLTNEVLLERKEILLRMIDSIDELIDNPGAAMSQCFKSRNLSYLKTRNLLIRLSGCDTSGTSTKIEITKAMEQSAVFEPEEKLYYDIFGCGKRDWSVLSLPADYKETIVFTMNEVLSEREQQVLKLRYGLPINGEGRNHTLEECSTIFNVTKEFIRQIESRALRKLRKRPYIDMLSYGLKEYRKNMKKAEADLQKRKNPSLDIWQDLQMNPKKIFDSFLFLPIEELGLSVRAQNCLYRNAMFFVFDIFAHHRLELACLHGVGRRSHNEIIDSVEPFVKGCKSSYDSISLFCQSIAQNNGIEFNQKESQASRLMKIWITEKDSEE